MTCVHMVIFYNHAKDPLNLIFRFYDLVLLYIYIDIAFTSALIYSYDYGGLRRWCAT